MKNGWCTTYIESNSFKLEVNLHQVVMHVFTKLEGEHPRDKIIESDRPWPNDEDNDRQNMMIAQVHFGSDSKTK